MSVEYKNNHYVPEWYQKRFLPSDQLNKELYYLDLKPGSFTDPRGVTHNKKALKKQGFRFCFSEKDLYTTNIRSVESREIEKHFFGQIDDRGMHAVNHFANYNHLVMGHDHFSDLMIFLSTQKLRTPKGLDWIIKQTKINDKNYILGAMIKLRQLHCALWTECIWLIADASESNTKFIISDHPVTVYNRVCGPKSDKCKGSNDPGIWLNGTHTIFPLQLDKILILTNLSWVRNPYQSELKPRPNSNPLRNTIFKFNDIQIDRKLSEQEVCEINYIIKKRAYRYIAAAKEEWLYPEKIISTQWNSYGDGYLLMPDPRSVSMGGEIIIGHNDGSVSAFDEYGRRPWQKDYSKETKEHTEFNTLYRFKGEFARLYGPYRRGRSFQGMSLEEEKDDEKYHNYHLGLEKRKWQKNKTKKQ